MAFALLYNGSDSQIIQDSYQAARTILSNNDRQNIDAVWSAGLSAWNSDANRVYNVATGVWHTVCLQADGVTQIPGLCDQDTHLIAISGNWARTVAAYGAVQGQPITRAGFVGLLKRMGAADPNTTRGGWIANALAEDLANTAIEPWP